MPSTCGLVDPSLRSAAAPTSEQTQSLSIEAIGDALRNALARDVVNLPRNLESIIEACRATAGADNAPPLALRLTLSTVVALMDGAGPGQIAARLQACGGGNDFKAALELVQLIALAQSGRRDGQSHDIATREFRALLQIIHTNPLPNGSTLLPEAHVLLRLHELDRSVAAMQRAAGLIASEGVNEADRLAQVVPLVREFASALRIAWQLSSTGGTPSSEEQTFLRVAASLPDLFDALARNDVPRFAAGILGVIEAAGLPHAPATPPSGTRQALPASMLRLITLGAELASATDADAAARVFETFALPPGSWSLQTQQPMWAISAYVGLAAGCNAYLTSGERPPSGEFGEVAAMVGFDRTWPIDAQARSSWFWGFFFPVIDVGAFLSLEAQSPGRATTSERPLRVLSPGALLHVNYKSLSLFGGVTLLPFSYGDSLSPAIRVMGGIAFGLPLFAL